VDIRQQLEAMAIRSRREVAGHLTYRIDARTWILYVPGTGERAGAWIPYATFTLDLATVYLISWQGR
jgi:hypothetical protein